MTDPQEARFQPLAGFKQAPHVNHPIWAVLCPGPSLGGWEGFDAPLDQRIAVNNALEHPHAGTWWCKLDQPKTVSKETWQAVARIRPTLIATQHMMKFWKQDKRIVNAYFALDGKDHIPYPFHFSMVAAIQFAFWRGAETIRVYGCDLAGISYYGSREPVETWANKKRWNRERSVLKTLTDSLAEKGCEVELR